MLRRRAEGLWRARPATMEVLRRSSVEYAAVAAALVECRFNPSRVVDGFRHRHVERLGILQGIDRELWNRPSQTFVSVLILAPILPIRRDRRSMPSAPRRETLIAHASFHRQTNRWSVQPSCLGGDCRRGDHHRRLGILYGQALRHHDRHQQADLARSRLAPARTGLREGISRARSARSWWWSMRRRRSSRPRRAPTWRSSLRRGPTCFMWCASSMAIRSLRKTVCCFNRRADLARMTQGLGRAAPVIGALAGDPSLRGLTRALSFGLLGVQNRPGQARGPAARADHVGGHHRSGAGRAAGELFVARAVDRADAASRASFATSSKSSRCSTFPRCSPARRRPMRSARLRPTSSSEPTIRRASA